MHTFKVIIISIIFVLFVSSPLQAEEVSSKDTSEDTVEKIVADYKALQLALKSGKINQAGYKQAMHLLEVRATLHKVLEDRKLLGSKVPIQKQRFFLEDLPPETESDKIYQSLIKIFGDKNPI